jgi:hypothetical protein
MGMIVKTWSWSPVFVMNFSRNGTRKMRTSRRGKRKKKKEEEQERTRTSRDSPHEHTIFLVIFPRIGMSQFEFGRHFNEF